MVLRNPEVHYRPYISSPFGPYLQQDLSSLQDHNPPTLKSILILPSQRLCLPKGFFPSGFPTKILYALLDCFIRATWPAHLSRLDLRFLSMLGEEYNACRSQLCNFLHSPVISSHLAPNIFLSILLLNALRLCSCLKVRASFTTIQYNW